MIEKPGIYSAADIPMPAYLADPCPVPSLSSSAAFRLLIRSPRHVWWEHPKLGGHAKPAKQAADIGSLAHDIVLGEGENIAIVVADDWRTKAAKQAREEARDAGRVPALEAQYHEALQMADAAREFMAQAAIPLAGVAENTLIAVAGSTWLRARPDLMNAEGKVILHYKTTKTSAAPEPFIRGVMRQMGYDVSLAFYRLVQELVTGETDWQHVILAQEQDPPHCCSLITLDPADWAIADDKVRRAIKLWQRCIDTGKWPGYSSQLHFATPTAWQLARAEEESLYDRTHEPEATE